MMRIINASNIIINAYIVVIHRGYTLFKNGPVFSSIAFVCTAGLAKYTSKNI